MKTLDIASKDIKHIFLSAFPLVMMFGAPLLLTGLMYFAFGGMTSGKGGFTLPVTKVVVANLDQPNQQSQGIAAGQMLVGFLQDKSLADIIQVSLVADEASARKAVDEQRAGVAIIIPQGFSSAAGTAALPSDQPTKVILYQDPTLTIGPGIVKDLVSHYMDAFSGAKIANQTAAGSQADEGVQRQVIQKYTTWLKSNGHSGDAANPSLWIKPPAGQVQSQASSTGAEPNPGSGIIGPTMAGMLVFFVFFMGAHGAESLIQEDEQGTLARLFTTPTTLSSVLGGKLLGVIVSLCVQVAILLLVSVLLFHIQWGQPVTILLVSIALIVSASGFGLLLMSFVKNSRQTGPVLGGVMTLAGLLGGLLTVGIPMASSTVNKIALITPQGWALQGWKLSLSGAEPSQVIFSVTIQLAMGLIFFAAGVARFRRRFV